MPNPVNKRNKFSKDEKPPKTRRTRVGDERPRKSHSGEKSDFSERAPREDKPSFGDKPPYRGKASSGDKPPYKKKEWGAGREDRPDRGSDKPRYGDKPSRGDKPSYGDKVPRGDKPSFGDKPYKKKEFGDKKTGERSYKGDKPRFGDKPRGDKPYGDKPSFRDKPRYGDKPPLGDRPERRSTEKKDWGEKRAFGKREDSGTRDEKGSPYQDKRPYRDKPAFGDRPYKKRDEDQGEKPANRDKPAFGDKPRRSDTDRPERSDKPASGERAPRGDKPFKSGDKPYKRRDDDRGEKKNFSRPYDKAREKSPEERASKPFRENKSFGTPTNASADGMVRLNKYIANAGVCSRREADRLIETGVISVNGKIVTELGFKVSPGDEINFGGQVLKKEKSVYVLLNKPKDYITTLDDPEGRKTVLELIHNATKERVYPVGRLDRNTTGLLLLTNDGEMTKKLTHPRYGVKKIYQVTLNKSLLKGDMQKISDGIELEDGPVKADDISYVGDGKDKTEIGIQLHSGRNRIVRRIFEHLGYDVVKLDRVYFAGLTKKDLPRGRWRLLTALEISMLKMVPGE
jgi:23S rRNA pseudouridine2605 synthase